MKTKITAVLLLLLCLTVSFSGCGKPKAGKAFAMPILEEPVSLDPQIAHSTAERLIISNCYEGLVTIAPDGKILNGVASSYTVSPDGLTYRFTLRPDATWNVLSRHGGLLKAGYGKNFKDTFPKALKADDFVFALQRVVDPQTASDDAYLFSAIDTVSAPDNQTVEIKLSYPDENFLYALASPGAMPCNREFFELTGGRYGLETGYMLCNGPFYVASWLEKTSIKLSKNESYKGERATMPASVTLYYNKDKTQIAEKMADEVYDAAFLTEKEWNALPRQKHYNAQSLTDTTMAFLFNQRDSALKNEHLRLALCHALVFESTHLPGELPRAASLVPPFCKIGAEPYLKEGENTKGLISYSTKRAQEEFEEALLELGVTSVEMDILCTEEYKTFVQEVLQLWQRTLGVKFVGNVTVLPDNELETAVRDGNYQIALYPVRAASAFTPDFLEQFGAGNYLGFEDAKYTAFLDRMRREKSDFSNLRAACKDAETYLLQHAVLLPVQYENNYFITNRDTDGIYFYSSRDYVYFINAGKK